MLGNFLFDINLSTSSVDLECPRGRRFLFLDGLLHRSARWQKCRHGVCIWTVWARLVLGGAASTLLTAAFNDKGLLGKVVVEMMQLMIILALGFNYVGFHASLLATEFHRVGPGSSCWFEPPQNNYKENTVHHFLHSCFAFIMFCIGFTSMWTDNFFGHRTFLAVLFGFQDFQGSLRLIIVQVYDPRTGFAKYAGHLQHPFISLDIVLAQEQWHLHKEGSLVAQSGWGTSGLDERMLRCNSDSSFLIKIQLVNCHPPFWRNKSLRLIDPPCLADRFLLTSWKHVIEQTLE